MGVEHKSASPSAIQVKNQWNTICTEQKLDVTRWPVKCEQTVTICHNVRLAHSSAHMISDNAGRIKDSAKPGTKLFVCVEILPQFYRNEPYQKQWMWVSYTFTALEINTVKLV
jgi:hypothetical protein